MIFLVVFVTYNKNHILFQIQWLRFKDDKYVVIHVNLISSITTLNFSLSLLCINFLINIFFIHNYLLLHPHSSSSSTIIFFIHWLNSWAYFLSILFVVFYFCWIWQLRHCTRNILFKIISLALVKPIQFKLILKIFFSLKLTKPTLN